MQSVFQLIRFFNLTTVLVQLNYFHSFLFQKFSQFFDFLWKLSRFWITWIDDCYVVVWVYLDVILDLEVLIILGIN